MLRTWNVTSNAVIITVSETFQVDQPEYFGVLEAEHERDEDE